MRVIALETELEDRLIRFELIGLRPYPGFARLFAPDRGHNGPNHA